MSQERVFGLDFLRALAVMLVLVAHASFLFLPLTQRLEAWWMLGHLGVELFFVLSGFLIGGILAEQASSTRFSVGGFWTRRWLRTLPNYYLFLVLNIVIARWTEGAWPHAAPNVVFMQNFLWTQPIFFVESWSLSVEEIFYLVAPLLLWLCRGRIASRWSPTLVVAAIVVLTGFRIAYVMIVDPDWDLSTRAVAAVRLDAIAYGVLVMLLCRRSEPLSSRVVRVIALAGTIGLAIAIALYLKLPKDTSFFARTGLFSLISISFAAWLPAASTWRSSGVPDAVERAVRRVARWSYALYLSQLTTLRVFEGLGFGNAQNFAMCLAQALLFATFAMASAAFVYRFFEAPILRWRNRWTRPEPSPTETLRSA
ncbi:MAG TPA: acyltransferase [Rudaea sp.]|nr:acyltransferase [Rudaea sp.]